MASCAPPVPVVPELHLHRDELRTDVSAGKLGTRGGSHAPREQERRVRFRLRPRLGRQLQRVGPGLLGSRGRAGDLVFPRPAPVQFGWRATFDDHAVRRRPVLSDRPDLERLHRLFRNEYGRGRKARRRSVVHRRPRARAVPLARGFSRGDDIRPQGPEGDEGQHELRANEPTRLTSVIPCAESSAA